MKLAALTASALVLVAGVANASDLSTSGIAVTRNVPSDLIYSARETAQLNRSDVLVTTGLNDQIAAGGFYAPADLDEQGLAANDTLNVSSFPGAASRSVAYDGR